MPQLVTDPDLLRQLEAPDAGPAAPQPPPSGMTARQAPDGHFYADDPARPGKFLQVMPPAQQAPASPPTDMSPLGQAQAAVAAGAPHAAVLDRLREHGHDVSPDTLGMKEVTDPALLQQLEAPDPQTPGVRFAPQGKPGAQGLVWDHDGGRDPKTGELVIAGKPMAENAPSQGIAAASSALSGIPIAGPYLERGAEKAGAFARQVLYGDPADQTESAVQGDVARSQAAYPKTSIAGGIAGGVIGTAPLIAAAPAAFGAGEGGLTVGKIGAGAASGMALGGTDAAVRSGGDLAAIKQGVIGGGIGGAGGPLIATGAGRLFGYAADALARARAPLPAGMSAPVAQALARAAEADGAANGVGASRIAEAGPDGMLADVGLATAGVLDTAVQRGGPGATAARQAIEQRAAASNQDLTVHLDRALGAPQGVATTEAGIRNSTAAARQAAYDTAYGTPIDYTSEAGRSLEGIVRDRVPPGIIARANNQMRIDGTPTRQMIMRPDGMDGGLHLSKIAPATR